MRVGIETSVRRDTVVIDDPQFPEMDAGRVVVMGKAEMVVGIEPSIISGSEVFVRINFDHNNVI